MNLLLLVTINLALGIAAGLIMHRSSYCVAGMFRDYFLFKQTIMLRTLMLLIVSSMVLFEVARRSGLLPLYPFPLLGSPSLANIAGGVLFGTGMVLAGGCVVGTLYKMGSGSVLSMTAFIGLVVGSGLYAEMHPWWVSLAAATSFFKGHITLPQILGCDPLLILLPVVLASTIVFYHWFQKDMWQRHSPAAGYLQPWKAALYLSFLGAISFILVGMPLGITTAYAKMAAYLELLFSPSHVADVAFFNAVPLNYFNDKLQLALQGGAGARIDAIAFIQFPIIFGIVLGAFISAVLIREFSPYFNVPARQYVSAFLGGVILALGSRMTPGCNIWHLFGGLPILAMQSILFTIGILPGALIGSIVLSKIVLPLNRQGISS